ncbi:TIGR04283 family arsenosugar biosynthesis glycosyltransferase [Bremerella sp. JC770]|uniref:TIGR04283 family arsenosugar biosynthesis glycosyltransferase n=1 Tax=Bremerella sp. JC770 TaxID=3232137 RepID=UPI00345B1815
MKTHLIVFTRLPEPGNTKTRLIPAIGAEHAALLQQRLTARTLDAARSFQQQVASTVEVQYTGGDAAAMQAMFGDDIRFVPQHEGDLGARLHHAIESAFRAEADRVVVIGADCPQLDAQTLTEANRQLLAHDIVIGPAEDGGYYLIGLTSPQASLFTDIAWGTSEVLAQTLRKVDALPVRCKLLPPLADIDHPEDLVRCRQWPQLIDGILPSRVANRLSIVIPTLNEAERLADTLHTVQRHAADPDNVEVIVADGGSDDATTEIAQQCQAKVAACRKGRGIQLNAGAALACGEYLLFLHADAQLPQGYDAAIREVLHRSAIAGAFRLRIDHDTPGLRIVASLANLRSKLLQRPYGDQGLFLRSQTFFEMGGFRNWPLMEDFELVQRLGRRGKIKLAETAMTVSARRWQKRGVMHTTCLNQAIVLAWRMGVSPERLAQWYRGKPAAST